MIRQRTHLLYLQNKAATTRQAHMDEARKIFSCEAAARALETCLMVHVLLYPQCPFAIICGDDAPRLTEMTWLL